MNGLGLFEFSVVGLAVMAAILYWVVVRQDGRIEVLEGNVEKLRRAVGSAAGQHTGEPELEMTHGGPRPVSPNPGVQPHPQQAPRIVSPTRAKRELERKFAVAAAARRTLQTVPEEKG